MSNYTGRVIEFLTSGTTRFGHVTAESQSRLQVTDRNGRRHSVPLNQVIIVHQELANSTLFGELSQSLDQQIGEIQEQIDTELLWEAVATEKHECSIDELTHLYFGKSLPCWQSAVFRAVLDDPVHFRIRGLCITPRSPQQVEDQLRAVQKREERELFRSRSIEWMRETLQAGGSDPVPGEMDGLLRRIEDFLKRREGAEVQAWLAEVDPHLTPLEVAIELLSLTGRLREDAHHLLILAGIEERFSQGVAQGCNLLDSYRWQPERTDFSKCFTLTIDDEDTREIDDALSVEIEKGTTRVGIHIADVAHFITKEDILDKEAFRRCTSIYLPDRTVNMLPPRLSCDLASLVCGALRPTMSFLVEFGEAGEIAKWRVVRGQVTVDQRLTYDRADDILRTSSDNVLGEPLLRLKSLAHALSVERHQRGALTINRPELKIVALNGQIDIKMIDVASPSRRMVSEMMILANSLAAQCATEERIPIIYRVQNPPSVELSVPDLYDPVALEELFQKLEPSRFSVYPQPHAGLGLAGYTQLTSPLRRFADLVMQRQVAAHLAGTPLPYELQELMEILGSVQAAEGSVRAVERKAKRLYVLKYLTQHPEISEEVVVLRRLPSGYLVETTDLFVRAQLASSADYEPGQVVSTRIDRIEPERGVFILRPLEPPFLPTQSSHDSP